MAKKHKDAKILSSIDIFYEPVNKNSDFYISVMETFNTVGEDVDDFWEENIDNLYITYGFFSRLFI